jgi:hypothetical protein
MESYVEAYRQKAAIDRAMTIAAHEAGHKVMYDILMPWIKAEYTIHDGMPAVKREAIQEVGPEHVVKLLVIALAGIMGELMYLGLDARAMDIIKEWRERGDYPSDLAKAIKMHEGLLASEIIDGGLDVYVSVTIEYLAANLETYRKEIVRAHQAFQKLYSK